MKYFTLFLALLIGSLQSGAQAAQTPNESTISVTGAGSVLRTPDDAIVYATLTTTNDSAAAAMSANNSRYDGLHAKLVALGIADTDIKTQSFNVNYVPRPQAGATATPPPYYNPRYGYTVTRSLVIDAGSRDLAGKAIDVATASDASNVSVAFRLKNQREAYFTALAAAMHDAQQAAQTMAAAAGLRIVTLRSAQSYSSYTPTPVPVMRSAVFAAAAPAPPTEITQPGDVEIRANVNVTYVVSR